MRILQIITLSDLGGAQSVMASLSNKLCEEHEVIVAAGEGSGKMWSLLDTKIKVVKIKYLKRALSPIIDLSILFYLMILNLQLKPDIVHLHSSKAGILGRIAFPRSRIVYTVHGFDSIRIAHRRFLPLEKYLQKFCKAIVGVSKYDERNMLREGISNHVSCVYNGIFKPDRLEKNPLEFLREYKRKILCIARLSPPKNSDLFIKTASLLPDYAFIWIGNLCEYKGYKPQNVFFLGNIPNAGAYNEYADLFILPSNYEGLPIVIIEAMSFGRPIVASNVGGISEIVFNDQNGYVVENKPSDFAEKIDYILQNENVYKSFSEKSLEIYEKNLTIDKMIEKYMNIYNQKYKL